MDSEIMEAMQETKINNSGFTKSDFSGPAVFLFIWWYYFVAPVGILKIYRNYLVSNIHYFSIPLLLRTLLSPWHRDQEGYGRGFDFERFIRVWSMNMVSRGVGFVVRSFVVVFGLLAEIGILAAGLVIFFFWLIAPAVIAIIVLYSIRMVF